MVSRTARAIPTRGPLAPLAALALPLLLSVPTGLPAIAAAESFEVEVVSGSTVSRVSGDTDGVRREVVTRADPSPPPPEPEREPPPPPEPVVVVVERDPPPPPRAGVIVHSAFGHPKHRRSRHRMRGEHSGSVGFPSPGSSVRGGRLTGGAPR